MALTGVARLSSAEEIAVPAGEVPFLRLPEQSVYADRALRLRQLAPGHAMHDYLLFIANVAAAQHAQLQRMPAVQVPDAATLREAARVGQPPLPAADAPRDAAWSEVLRSLLRALQPRVDGRALSVVETLLTADDQHLARQAERLLSATMLGLDLGAAPLIAAALQVYWTRQVIEVQRLLGEMRPFRRTREVTLCPCCGSRPTSSITHIGPDASGYRYLNCSLCATQWHMVRIKCSHCESAQGIHYEQLAPLAQGATTTDAAKPAAVQVECCDHCGHYLKIVHMERDHQVEPVADDLATVTLDLVVSDAGRLRHGVNLMLLFGDDSAG
jgi:FdhE protein